MEPSLRGWENNVIGTLIGRPGRTLQWSPALEAGKTDSVMKPVLDNTTAAMEPSLRGWENAEAWELFGGEGRRCNGAQP